MKTLSKTANLILYDLTHPTACRWRRASVNTFLDSSSNIFDRAANFTKYLTKILQSSVTPACQTWKLKLMDIIKKYLKRRTKEQKFVSAWKKKID